MYNNKQTLKENFQKFTNNRKKRNCRKMKKKNVARHKKVAALK